MNPKQFLHLREKQQLIIEHAEATILAMQGAIEFPDASELRPATAKDVVEGAILFYPAEDDADAFWEIVSEVYRPSDPFKAYMAESGCRHGIRDAFVYVE